MPPLYVIGKSTTLVGEEPKLTIYSLDIEDNKFQVMVLSDEVEKEIVNFSVHPSICPTEEGFWVTDSLICLHLKISSKNETVEVSKKFKMCDARRQHAMVSSGHLLAVMGGVPSAYNERSEAKNSVMVRSFALEKWHDGPPLPECIAAPVACRRFGRNDVFVLADTLKVYTIRLDPLINKDTNEVWTKLKLDGDRPKSVGHNYGISMALHMSLDHPSIRLVIGGGILQKTYIFTQENNDRNFNAKGVPKPNNIHNHGALFFYNKKLILLGGYEGSNGTNSCEIIDTFHEQPKWSVMNMILPTNMLQPACTELTE